MGWPYSYGPSGEYAVYLGETGTPEAERRALTPALAQPATPARRVGRRPPAGLSGVPTLHLAGAIGYGNARGHAILPQHVEAWLQSQRGARGVRIVLDSEGGLVRDADEIFDLLRHFGAHVTVHVPRAGQCTSAAVKVLLAGDWRVAHPSARFCIHYTASTPTRWTADALRAVAQEMDREDGQMLDEMIALTGASRFQLERLSASDEVFDAAQACHRYGLIDEIEGE